MSRTNQQIVDQAAQELGYLEYGANLDATDGADAMNVLNQMMAAKHEGGSWRLNWFPQDDLTETCPIPRWAEWGVVSNLAVALGTLFNIAPSMQTYDSADKGNRLLLNAAINLKLEGADMSHLPQGENIRYDIETDEF